jgi:hypothetical protein
MLQTHLIDAVATQERRAVFELLASDGTTLLERHTLPSRFCHLHRLGRNLGLSRLPLVNETKVRNPATCRLRTR